MAVGRISVKTGSKGKASPHVSYILREDKYKPHAKKVEELGKTGHGNMPQWAEKNPKLFWQEADTHERKNGSTYREHILTLPRELNEEQRIELVEEWIKNEIGDKHPYIYAMHNPIALDGKEQPHCHLMFCERELDGIERSPDQFFKRYNAKSPEKGGAKKANTGLDYSVRRQQLKEQRSRWEKTVNLHLERAGSKERVNLKNWKEKGLTEKPVNINMIEMSKLKKSQQDLKKAQFEIYKALGTSPTVELNKQNRLAKEAQQKQQEQKAELHQKQLETLNSFKAEPTQENINQAQGFTNEKLNELKAEAEQSKGEIEQLAQRQELNQTHLKKYIMSKRTLNTIEQVAKERAEQKDQQEHETPTTPPPPQAQKIPQEQTPPAEQLGHGLSEKDESNIKGMREIIKATFANDPAKLKIALERLDKQAEAVSRGEIKLSDRSFVTKEAPKFDYERPAEQLGQDKGKDR